MGRKSIDEFQFSDDAMFLQVMQHDEICRLLIESIFPRKVERIERHAVQDTKQATISSKAIRFDVYFVGDGRVYDIEMQKASKRDLPRRARYYLSVNDIDQVKTGMRYSELPESYVIFIYLFDPFHEGYAKYVQEPAIKPTGKFINNGTHVVYLNTKFEEDSKHSNVGRDLAELLIYLRDPKLALSVGSSRLVQEIDYAVNRAKSDAAERRAIMSLDEILEERAEEAREEGRVEGEAKGRAAGKVEGEAKGKAETLRRLKMMGLLPEDFELPDEKCTTFGVKETKLGE